MICTKLNRKKLGNFLTILKKIPTRENQNRYLYKQYCVFFLFVSREFGPGATFAGRLFCQSVLFIPPRGFSSLLLDVGSSIVQRTTFLKRVFALRPFFRTTLFFPNDMSFINTTADPDDNHLSHDMFFHTTSVLFLRRFTQTTTIPYHILQSSVLFFYFF